MAENTVAENKMGVMPVNKLLISMALPMMISMLVQALYNVVDSIFVAKLSEDALTAVSLAFPMQNLMIAVAGGIGVGMNAILSRSLGQKNMTAVNKSAAGGAFLEALGYLLFLIIGVTLVRTFFVAQDASAEITELGVKYLSVVLIFSFGIFGQFTFERMLQSTGKTLYTMFTQMTGAIINIILDPILIFGLLGAPKMGITGAAVATVIGQICAAVFAFTLNKRKNHEIDFSFRKMLRPDGKIIKTILSVGIPSMIMQAIGSVMTFGMNKILIVFSSTAVAVFGVYFKLQSFVFMPVFGLNNGMVPIVSYNYGAENKERMIKTIKLSLCYAVGIMLLGLILIQIFPTQMLMLFNASEHMLSIGVPALRTISLSFIFAGIAIIFSSCFQALGNGILSMFVSIARQLIALLPAAYLLSKLNDVNLVWWSFPIAEIVSVTLSVIFFIRMYEKVIKPLGQGK